MRYAMQLSLCTAGNSSGPWTELVRRGPLARHAAVRSQLQSRQDTHSGNLTRQRHSAQHS